MPSPFFKSLLELQVTVQKLLLIIQEVLVLLETNLFIYRVLTLIAFLRILHPLLCILICLKWGLSLPGSIDNVLPILWWHLPPISGVSWGLYLGKRYVGLLFFWLLLQDIWMIIETDLSKSLIMVVRHVIHCFRKGNVSILIIC